MVLENPTVQDFATQYGTFVVIALDPVAFVEALCDEQATREAMEMSPKQYLAMVNLPGEMTWTQKAGGIQLNLSFMLAGQGLPPPPKSWAAIPISPSPPLPDSDRPPVVPSAPLPWPNCYLRTLERLTARVSRVYQHHTPGPSFTEDDHDEIRYLAGIDRRADATAREAARPRRQSPPPEEHADDDDLMAKQTKVDASDPVASMLEMFPHLHADGRPEMKDHVQMWVDITVIDQPASPEDLVAEMQHLKEIEWNWAERTIAAMLANQPQTTAWLAGAEHAEAPQLDEELSNATVDDDGSILPEDAIEHRAERLDQVALAQRAADRLVETAGDISRPETIANRASSPVVPLRAQSTAESSTLLPIHSPGTDAVDSHPKYSVLAALKWTLAGVSSWISGVSLWVSHFRSFFWSLLWRKPFAKT